MSKPIRTKGLRTQLEERFERDLDPKRWMLMTEPAFGNRFVTRVRCSGNRGSIDSPIEPPPAPGKWGGFGIATTRKRFNPGLKGTNGLEVTFVDYRYGGEYMNQYTSFDGHAIDEEDPISGLYLVGFALTVSSFQGMVGSEPDRNKDPEEQLHRTVQIHFDWYQKWGLAFNLNRNVIPGDKEKYHIWTLETDGELAKQHKVPPVPYITIPGNSVSLAVQLHPLGITNPAGHRMGLWIGNDGDSLGWTLDGRMMDEVDISGFFGSSAELFKDGAYAIIAGGSSYAENTIVIEDAALRVS